jgi:hypothetical protein
VDDQIAKEFVEVREALFEILEPTMQAYFCQMWDPLSYLIIVKETKEILTRILTQRFPNFPPKLFPQVLFMRNDEADGMELSVQFYYNSNTDLKYLGTCDIGGSYYDLYYRDRYGYGAPIFVARYGHDSINSISGSHEAEADFLSGKMTPLSLAYQIALDNGYIEQ